MSYLESGFIETPKGRICFNVLNPEADGTPLILINGGPCGNRSMLKRTVGNAVCSRPVISYSQMNSPGSEPLSRKDRSYWNIGYYTEEVGRVIDFFGLDRAILFGHSWGGTLALNYASLVPEKCAGVIAASPLISASAWIKDTRARRLEVRPEAETFVETIMQAGIQADRNDLLDKAEMALFISRYQSSLLTPNEIFTFLLKKDLNTSDIPGREVYLHMWGRSEYEVTGTLKDMDISGMLGGLKVPVLYACGGHDEILPSTLESFAAMTPGSEFFVSKNGSHCFMEDAPRSEREVFIDMIETWMKEKTDAEIGNMTSAGLQR